MKLLDLRRKLNGDKALKAFADVEMNDGTVIREFRILQEPGQRTWVACPQISWKDPTTSKIKYKVIITLPGHIKGEVDALILSQWFGMQEKENGIERRERS